MKDSSTPIVDATSSGPMSAEEIEKLRDIQRYLDHCIDNSLTFQTALRNLSIEVQGLIAGRPAELRGLTVRPEDMEAMANDPDIQRELEAIRLEESGGRRSFPSETSE